MVSWLNYPAVGVKDENGLALFSSLEAFTSKIQGKTVSTTCRPQFLSNCVISYDRACQPLIKIISIEKTFALHKSAQKKHFFLEFFLKESSWWALLNHLKIENFEKGWVFTLDDTLSLFLATVCVSKKLTLFLLYYSRSIRRNVDR